MSEPALSSMLELLACQHMADLLACFSARVDALVPGGTQILGLIPFPGSEIVCDVTGETLDTLHLGVNDFTHPLAQVIRSGKPAVWLSLNYGARIEHPHFRELVLRQSGACGLYALPLPDGQGRVGGIWAILAPSETIEGLLNVESLFSPLIQVFQHRSKELYKTSTSHDPDASLQTLEAAPWRIPGERVRHLYETLYAGKPILIAGETGTGKTWLAHYLHRYSAGQASLVSLDCAVLSEEWQGMKIFGENSVANSALVKAHQGILLIENIDRLSARWHGYFQHFLDTKEVLSMDGRDAGWVDLKLILTSSDCNDWKNSYVGFFQRFAGNGIYLPPLRERKQDINVIIECILKEQCLNLPAGFKFHEKNIGYLLGYSYPGNIRELENILLDYVSHVQFEGIDAGNEALREKTKERNADMFVSLYETQEHGSLKSLIAHYEAIVIRQRLKKYRFDKERTAASLSISRRSLDMKCKKSGIVR